MSEPKHSAPAAARELQRRSAARGRAPSTISGYALAIGKALDHYGIDAGRIFKAAGIPPALANDPMSRLPAASMTALFKACVDVTHDPYFGLTVARFIHISNLHALGYAMAASGTLLDCCKRVARYFHLVSQTADFSVEETEQHVTLRGRLLADVCGETEDAFLGFLVLAMRQLHKAGLNPVSVELQRAMPPQGSLPFERLFRAPVKFAAPETVLLLDRGDMLQPLAGACPELAQHNDNIALDYLARLDRSDVVTRVRQKIVEQLIGGDCTRERVAAALGMSDTLLQGRLRRSGTSFHAVQDETCRELACSYMLQSQRSFTEIAFLLGFSDCSNFTRSFKRWTGCSPTEFRRRGRAAGSE